MNLPRHLLALSLLLVPLAAAAQAEFDLKTKAAYWGEGARDLGATPPPGTAAGEKHSAAFADLQPTLWLPFGENSGFFTRVELFGSTGDAVIQNENEVPVASENYVALREFWLEYGGMSDFPGEKTRLGLQRVREQSSLWWDRDIESVRWIFDTTLVQGDIGIGEQFRTWRSDDVELTPSQKKRAYVWFSLDRQWRPGYAVGVRAAWAQDHGEQPEASSHVEADTKTQERKYLWLGLHTGNGYFDPRSTLPVEYWLEAVGLAGRREYTEFDPIDPTLVVDGRRHEKVAALGGDAGLRFRMGDAFVLGFQGVFAQGDTATSDRSRVFAPTGLESNRARFTGTRALINRFNEALGANWSNLRDAAAYVAIPAETFDFSAIAHQIKRDNGDTAFAADGIDAQTVNNSTDIGRGYDLVISKYFSLSGDNAKAASFGDDDGRSNVRLRASEFVPGEAYGPGLDPQYRVMLETTLWF